jgi:hypothetical protein
MSQQGSPLSANQSQGRIFIIIGCVCLLPAFISIFKGNAAALDIVASILMSTMFVLMGFSDHFSQTSPQRSNVLKYAYKIVGIFALLTNGWLLIRHWWSA